METKPLVIENTEKEKAEKKNEKLTPGQQYAMDAEKAEGDEKKKVSGAVRRGILAILKDNYGVEENDFISAELEIVPAGKARDAGRERAGAEPPRARLADRVDLQVRGVHERTVHAASKPFHIS